MLLPFIFPPHCYCLCFALDCWLMVILHRWSLFAWVVFCCSLTLALFNVCPCCYYLLRTLHCCCLFFTFVVVVHLVLFLLTLCCLVLLLPTLCCYCSPFIVVVCFVLFLLTLCCYCLPCVVIPHLGCYSFLWLLHYAKTWQI